MGMFCNPNRVVVMWALSAWREQPGATRFQFDTNTKVKQRSQMSRSLGAEFKVSCWQQWLPNEIPPPPPLMRMEIAVFPGMRVQLQQLCAFVPFSRAASCLRVHAEPRAYARVCCTHLCSFPVWYICSTAAAAALKASIFGQKCDLSCSRSRPQHANL